MFKNYSWLIWPYFRIRSFTLSTVRLNYLHEFLKFCQKFYVEIWKSIFPDGEKILQKGFKMMVRQHFNLLKF